MKNVIIKNIIFFILSLVFATSSVVGKTPESSELLAMKAKVYSFIKEKNKNGIHIDMKGDEYKISIGCPMGQLCLSDSPYARLLLRSFSENLKNKLTFMFVSSSKIINLEFIKNNQFMVLYDLEYIVNFPLDGWRIFTTKKTFLGSSDNKNFEITSFSDGVLKGKFNEKLTSLSVGKTQGLKKCSLSQKEISYDCYYKFRSNIPLTVNFEIPVDLSVLDCTKNIKSKRCGVLH